MLIFMLEIRRLVGPDVPIVAAILLALLSPSFGPLGWGRGQARGLWVSLFQASGLVESAIRK
jgi:hypothetical protein